MPFDQPRFSVLAAQCDQREFIETRIADLRANKVHSTTVN